MYDHEFELLECRPLKNLNFRYYLQVQITKFVVAPEPTDEAAQLQINCEAADVDVSMENMEQMNDDSLLTEESFDEQQDAALLTEEEELLFDHAEHAGVEESSGNELSLSIIAPQLDVSSCRIGKSCCFCLMFLFKGFCNLHYRK